MPHAARVGDPIEGGFHCHGHDHGPQPSPGIVTTGATRVFIEGRPAARALDQGHSPSCCGGVGNIVLGAAQAKVIIEGMPAAAEGAPTIHCGMGPGKISKGASKVQIP